MLTTLNGISRGSLGIEVAMGPTKNTTTPEATQTAIRYLALRGANPIPGYIEIT